VIVSPASLTVIQYQTATFYCSADGNPKPSVSWSKTSGTGLVNTDGKDNKLQINSAGYNDSGSYVCTAANILGQAKKVVKLFVEGKHDICSGVCQGAHPSLEKQLCKFNKELHFHTVSKFLFNQHKVR